jgi:hypothetical protein
MPRANPMAVYDDVLELTVDGSRGTGRSGARLSGPFVV